MQIIERTFQGNILNLQPPNKRLLNPKPLTGSCRWLPRHPVSSAPGSTSGTATGGKRDRKNMSQVCQRQTHAFGSPYWTRVTPLRSFTPTGQELKVQHLSFPRAQVSSFSFFFFFPQRIQRKQNTYEQLQPASGLQGSSSGQHLTNCHFYKHNKTFSSTGPRRRSQKAVSFMCIFTQKIK